MSHERHRPVIRDVDPIGWRIVCEECGILLDFRPLRDLLFAAEHAKEFTVDDWDVPPYEPPSNTDLKQGE